MDMNADKVIKWVRSLDDEKVLKRIRKAVDERIQELRKMGAEWSETAIQELWNRLNPDERRLIEYLATRGGSALKSEILRNFGWKEMKPTGVIAGINTQARNMGYRDIVRRSSIRVDGNSDIRYELDEKWLSFIRRMGGG